MPKFLAQFKAFFSKSKKIEELTQLVEDEDLKEEHITRAPSIKNLLQKFSNSFWNKAEMGFGSNSELLKQFIDEETLDLTKRAAGKFDFENSNQALEDTQSNKLGKNFEETTE